MTPQEIVVERTPTSESRPAVRRIHRQASALTFASFLLAVVLLPLFFYTFWVILEAMVRAWHLPRATSLLGRIFPEGFAGLTGWPFDGAFLLSTLAAWGILYLSYDRLALFGNEAMQAVLKRQTATRLGMLPPSGTFFVELRPAVENQPLRNHLRPDIGWLVLASDNLAFVGDSSFVTIPWERIVASGRKPFIESGRSRLGSTWLRLPVGTDAREDIRLLVRDDAKHLSDTALGARRLLDALLTKA